MIEAILTRLNSIPADKAFHFAAGAILFAVAVPFMLPTYALACVILVGFLKELYDAVHAGHTPDRYDALATSAGGALAFFCTYF